MVKNVGTSPLLLARHDSYDIEVGGILKGGTNEVWVVAFDVLVDQCASALVQLLHGKIGSDFVCGCANEV